MVKPCLRKPQFDQNFQMSSLKKEQTSPGSKQEHHDALFFEAVMSVGVSKGVDKIF